MNSSSKGSLPYSDARRVGGKSHDGTTPSNAQSTEAFPAFDPTIVSNESYDINTDNTGNFGFARYAGDDSHALNRLITAATRFSVPQLPPPVKNHNIGAGYRLVGDVRNGVPPAIPRHLLQVQPGLNPYFPIPPAGFNPYPQIPTFGFNVHTPAFVSMASPSRTPPGVFSANTPSFVPGGSPAPFVHPSSNASLVHVGNDNKFAFRSKPPVAPRAMVQQMFNRTLPDPYNQIGNTEKALIPSGPPPIRHFTTRFDKKLKDLVITHEGVFYNAVRVEKQTFPDGTVETETFHDFDLENGYNILEKLAAMSPQDRATFFSDKFAEIIIDGPYIEAYYNGPETLAAYMKEHKKVDVRATSEVLGGVRLDVGGASAKGKEKEPSTPQPKTVLDILALLGPDFPTKCRNLFVRLVFPPSEAPAQLPLTHPPIPHASLGNKQSARPHAGAIDCGTTPLLWHLTLLIDPLNTFTNLRRLDITLQTPSGSPKPVTLEHMDHILPFYDLESFLGWQVWWTHEYITHPERMLAWPMEQTACEWNKICVQRDKWWAEIEGAVFVRRSVFHGNRQGGHFGGPGGSAQFGGPTKFGGGKGKGKYGGPHVGGAPKRGRYR